MHMTFQATRLFARYTLNRRLERGKKVRLSSTTGLLDSLPYNSDLQPVEGFVKVSLTALRIGAIAISVFLGYALDGTVRPNETPFAVSSAIDVASDLSNVLTVNSGEDITSMAKLSCLRISNNNDVYLFKGYVGGDDIICEDGMYTYSTKVLIASEIRSGQPVVLEGESMNGMNILNSVRRNGKLIPGLNISDRSITYERLDRSGTATGDECRIVLNARKADGLCEFGVWRSAGSGFLNPVHLKITTSCQVQILGFPRMLHWKPVSMPPRMSFLYQVIDAIIVSVEAKTAPRRMGSRVVATVTFASVVVIVIIAISSTLASIGLWLSLRNGKMKDLMSPRGIASLWGSEKYGQGSSELQTEDLFVALDENARLPYLGSMDRIPIEDDEVPNVTKSVIDLQDNDDGMNADECETASDASESNSV